MVALAVDEQQLKRYRSQKHKDKKQETNHSRCIRKLYENLRKDYKNVEGHYDWLQCKYSLLYFYIYF